MCVNVPVRASGHSLDFLRPQNVLRSRCGNTAEDLTRKYEIT